MREPLVHCEDLDYNIANIVQKILGQFEKKGFIPIPNDDLDEFIYHVIVI